MASHEARWDKGDLERRLCHALDIAEQCVDRLASSGYADPKEPINNVRPEKLISETAVLLYAASAANHHDRVSARIDRVARLLIPHARSARMLLGVCLEPALALDYSEAHACLSRLGYQDLGFDKLLRKSRSSQAALSCERVPHRVLEQDWIRDIWRYASSNGLQRACRSTLNSVLSQPMDLLSGRRQDIYAFTHALMYVTDFNIRPQRLPRPRAVILAEAEAALARCLDAEDYDLGGEVLMAWPLTEKSWSVISAFGFRILAHAEDKVGVLPAPTTRPERLNKLLGNDRTDYFLATAYHTVYVMGLLCAAALQAGRSPPAKLTTSAARKGSANKILSSLDADCRRPLWRDELDLLSDTERDALTGFLFNIALYRKISRREFDGVHELLKVDYDLGLANTPAASQAAEMLERLASFANLARAPGRIS